MAVNLLRRLAATATPPVFALAADGGHARCRRLRLDPRLRVVDSPRQATTLLVLGELPQALRANAARIHDQIPEPRGLVVWGDAPPAEDGWEHAAHVQWDEDPMPVVGRVHRGLVTNERPCDPVFGPIEHPVVWKGIGPHGQGGQGMMGGKPYGRAMAMTGPDVRDGLQLDRLQVPLGPFVPWMPPGLQLELTLQGDVIVELSAVRSPMRRPDLPPVFERAKTQPVPLAALERARAAHLLEVTAQLLTLHGLDALAVRMLEVASNLDAESSPAKVRTMASVLRRLAALRGATRGVGRMQVDDVASVGLNARAAGGRNDARTDDPSYRDLGFEPIVSDGGDGGDGADASARWRQRLDEAAQALELAARAGDRMREPDAVLETPRGPCNVELDWTSILPSFALGQSFDAFVTTLVSLDLDLTTRETPCPT